MRMHRQANGGDGSGPEELRRILRSWEVPAPPPELEDELRRTFHRRRSNRGHALGLLVAAAAALVAVVWIGTRGRPLPPQRPVVATRSSPRAPAALAVESSPAPTMAQAAVTPVHTRRRRAPASRDETVIVEPGQGRLLAELGRRLADLREAVPTSSRPPKGGLPAALSDTIPSVPDVSVPSYRGEWETVAGEWPHVHLSRQGR